MKLSNRLQRIKNWAKKHRFEHVFKAKMDTKLASELLNLRSHDRDLINEQVWFWAFMYYSKVVKIDYSQNIIIIDALSNKLIMGEHRLAGFITAEIKQESVIIIFSSGKPFNRILPF